MAEQVKAEVSKVYEDSEGRDGKPFKSTRFTVLTNDNQRYSTFDPEIGRIARDLEGRMATMSIERKGKFQNVVSIAPSSSNGTEARPPQRPRDPGESRMIVRQVALKCAVDLACSKVIEFEQTRVVADKFVLWIEEQSAVKRMTAEGDEV